MEPSTHSPVEYILHFESDRVCLENSGGKGANLARLVRAGFNVPGGFIIITSAYLQFTANNRLEPVIQSWLPVTEQPDTDTLDHASAGIQGLFHSGSIPAEVKEQILRAYQALGQGAVAVRSSATAEDLPEISFAGQQDTYLNVIGEEALIQAVNRCWASLWTARAIGYRLRNHVPQTGLSLAVVVQRMAQSQSSGVMFTANPLTGLREETVIDATLGLGEALVSGQVVPDQYVVDTAGKSIRSVTLGEKATVIRGREGGGTLVESQSSTAQTQALPDEQILVLSQIGQKAADLFGGPQDIEWAWADGFLHVLQSRPVTSLFPVPPAGDGAFKVYISFGAFQGMLEPMTPVGRDMLRSVFAAGGEMMGFHGDLEHQTTLVCAGERLWINITSPLSNTAGRKFLSYALAMVEPSSVQALNQVMADPRVQPGKKPISITAASRLARFIAPLAANVLMNLAAPERRRKRIVAATESLLQDVSGQCDSFDGTPREQLTSLMNVLDGLMDRTFSHIFIPFISCIAASMASLNLLNQLAKKPSEGGLFEKGFGDQVLEVTRALPHNPTTEMDLSLWHTAQLFRADAEIARLFESKASGEISRRYLARTLPASMLSALDAFLAQYGGRGFGEIDLGRTRWQEDPTHVIDVISGYLKINNPELAPDVVFARGEDNAQKAIDALLGEIRRKPGGAVKSRLASFAAGRVRALMGMRERPKFFVVRLLWIYKRNLQAVGEKFAREGILDTGQDIFFLTFKELHQLASGADRDWKKLAAERKQSYQREMLRRQIPRILLSDGRAFYEGMANGMKPEQGLQGSPVSPGIVEGTVRVVFDPRRANLLPGEIMVCPGTDPSWTPLFLTAGGLVMEVGGMMTHGAVVAREYGIPAVVGVDQATKRLKTGQRIRVNGSTGQVSFVGEKDEGGKSKEEG